MSQATLYLRELEESDIPEILGWFDGEVGRLAHGMQEGITAEQLRPDPASHRGVRVGVVPDEGVVGVFNWIETPGTGSFFIGIVVPPGRVGSGYGAMVVELGIGLLFDQLRAHRVELRAATYNRHVMGMLKTGFMTLEGIHRDTLFVDGRYESTVVASMLEHEYRQLIADGRMLPGPRCVDEPDLRRARHALSQVLSSSRVSTSWGETLPAAS